MSEPTSQPPGTLERILLRLEEMPWAHLYRVLVGFLLLRAYDAWSAGRTRGWDFLVWFLGLLLILRVVPGLVRRLLPFSASMRAAWAQRRAWSRRFDSYQWRKLLGLGLGMLIQLLVSRRIDPIPAGLVAVCLLGGAIGVWRWHAHETVLTPQASP